MVLPRTLARFNRRFLNRVMVHLAARLPGFAVLHHRGRRSGRRYAIPINVFVSGDRYLFALTYGRGTDWQRNVEAAGRCTILTRGRVVALHAPREHRGAPAGGVPAPVVWFLARIGVHHYLELRRG